jgi:chorismate-pyruvate lyase
MNPTRPSKTPADSIQWLPAEEAVTARALREAEVKPAGLWARRSRLALRGAPLLMQELILPAMGRV